MPIVYHMVNHSESRLNLVFSALSDPTRRSILARLEKEPRLSISELAEPFAMTLPAVLKHLDMLCETGLIRRAKSGRTVWVEIVPGSLRVATDWLERHRRFWTAGLDRLVVFAEAQEREMEGNGT
jgi:DNA-binding transcriptional ArsR family regulator